MARLKRWAVIMYSKSLGCSKVYDARCQLFTHGTRMLDHTPPTQAALFSLGGRCCWQPLYGGKLRGHSSMYRKSRNGVGCKKRKPKTGCHFGQSCLMQTVRSCIIMDVHKHAEVAANIARHDSGALFYVHVKVDVSTILCFRLLLVYSKQNWLLELAIS